MALPNFLIIGAQKAGTTWLYENLRRHPQVYMPAQVEMNFFSNRFHIESAEEIGRYRDAFAAAEPFKAVGEKTPAYFWTVDRAAPFCRPLRSANTDIPGSVLRFLGPQVRLLLTLRHPAMRAVSAYHHHRCRGRVPEGASVQDMATHFGIADMGFYARHLKAWLRVFPRESFLVTIMEDAVLGDQERYLDDVAAFLQVSAFDSAAIVRESINGRRQAAEPLSAADAGFLRILYADDMDALREMLGDDLPTWRKIDEALRTASG